MLDRTGFRAEHQEREMSFLILDQLNSTNRRAKGKGKRVGQL